MISVLFFGNYSFSLEYLKTLLNDTSIKIVGVVCLERENIDNPVVNYVLQKREVQLFLIKTLKELNDTDEINDLSFDFILSAAFPRRIPNETLKLPKCHALNIHPSLLPDMKGPDPIRRTILNGKNEFGISIHEMVEDFDAGDIFWQQSYIAQFPENTGQIMTKLIDITASKIPMILKSIKDGKLQKKNQLGESSYAANMSYQEMSIEENLGYHKIVSRCRAAFPYRELWFTSNTKEVYKISQSNVEINDDRLIIEINNRVFRIEK